MIFLFIVIRTNNNEIVDNSKNLIPNIKPKIFLNLKLKIAFNF